MTTGGPDHPREALSAYLDGELEAVERASVEAHLKGCAGCSALLADLRLLATASRDEEVPPVPQDLAGKIAARIAEEAPATETVHPAGPPMPWRRFRAPLAAAAMLAVATALWVVFQGSPDDVTRQILGTETRLAEPEPSAEKQKLGSSGRLDAVGADAVDENMSGVGGKAALDKVDADAVKKEVEAPEGEMEIVAQERGYAPDPGAVAKAGEEPKRIAEQSLDDGRRSRAASSPAYNEPTPPAAPALAETDDALREEADVAAPGDDFAPSPPAAKDRERQVEDATPRDALARSNLAPAATLDRPEEEEAAAAAAGGAYGFAQLAPGERTLVLTAQGYEIRLGDSGALTLRATDYACTIPGADPPDETRTMTLTDEASDAQAASREIGGLRSEDVAVSRIIADSETAPRKAGATAEVGEAKNIVPWTLALLEPDGSIRLLDPSAEETADLATRLHDLVRTRYTPTLTTTCGPPPPPFENR